MAVYRRRLPDGAALYPGGCRGGALSKELVSGARDWHGVCYSAVAWLESADPTHEGMQQIDYAASL
jgi:hypothetical protein